MTPPRPEVWITGLGPVGTPGVGRDAFFGGLFQGGPALPFVAEEHADARYLRRLSGLSRSAVVAGRMALLDAAYPEDPELRNETGVVLGTAFGSAGYHFQYYEALFRRGLKEASPLLFSESVLNAASGHLSQYLRLRGPSLTLVGGEDAGLAAIVSALDGIRAGASSAYLAGGAEERTAIIGRALEAEGIRAMGEGAALVLLEDEGAARRRGAKPACLLLGAGWGRASRGGAARGEHVARAVEEALADAGAGPAEVGTVVGGADGGDLDLPEALGLISCLDRDRPVRLAAPKEVLGEGFGFTSAAQAALAALVAATGRAPAAPGRAYRGVDLPPAWRARPGAEPPAGSLAMAVAATRRGGACAVVFGPGAGRG